MLHHFAKGYCELDSSKAISTTVQHSAKAKQERPNNKIKC